MYTTQTEQQSQVQGPLKYADLLARSKDQKDADQRDLHVAEAKQDVERSILDNRKDIFVAQRTLAEEKSKFPLNIKGIISAQVELEDLQRGLKALEDLKAELF